ncbi:MAG: hypothetical protein IPP66_23200 [Anaerolineales bacterium]|nr:hypothetical protein [Anaerolineales bacterium]
MLPETIQLETLRQKIEDSEYEAGDKTDYLSYGKPNAAQAKQAKELIERLNQESKSARAELKQLLTTLRAQHPQAVEEWVEYHLGILQVIVNEKTEAVITPRKNVAKETIQNWEKVRAGEIEYVNINWHFLKDYKASVRTITNHTDPKEAGQSTSNNKSAKSWWPFGK